MKGAIIEARGVRLGEGTGRRDGLSFTVGAGEVVALAGRPGPGATALLEAVAGLRPPAAGTVRVRGADPYTDGLRPGAVWRTGGWFPGLTVAETVDGWRRWTLDPLPAAEALRRTGLADRADVRFERLDAGEQRLLDLSLALVGRSDVLLLDEPTAGLGAAAADRVWRVLHELAAAGAAVLLTPRDPAEARLADRVCGAPPPRANPHEAADAHADRPDPHAGARRRRPLAPV
ncbi:ATP-binding cassette domain-containing protein [Actinomadura algeriensis]|uniref:ABC-2 type transport system ATP-binding protein n=1 Tax=Actinomadura algeriensis TaxID=1679523 RepID=A0ABR9JW74_9ACTN|nr:ATP-binding cassette domain-containing protein [Actinomadura algeriensis]MBE1534390.1 ABC-2 type transport system ATP-binding protein [Actinomadura algeriensis]